MMVQSSLVLTLIVASPHRLAVHLEKAKPQEIAALEQELRAVAPAEYVFLPAAATGAALKALSIPVTPEGMVRAMPELGVDGIAWVRVLERKESLVAQVQVYVGTRRETSVVSSALVAAQFGATVATEIIREVRGLFADSPASPPPSVTAVETAGPDTTPAIRPAPVIVPSPPPPTEKPTTTAGTPKRVVVLGCSFSEQARGVVIGSVLSGSAAEKAGLRSGMRLVTFNGQQVEGKPWIIDKLRSLDQGATVILSAEDERGSVTSHVVRFAEEKDASRRPLAPRTETRSDHSSGLSRSANELESRFKPPPSTPTMGHKKDAPRMPVAPRAGEDSDSPNEPMRSVTESDSRFTPEPGKLTVGYKKETLKKRAEKPTFVGGYSVGLAGIGVLTKSVNVGGGGFDLRLSGIAGRFPDESGGSLVGIAFGLRSSVFVMGGKLNVPGIGSPTFSQVRTEAAGELTFVLMFFGEMESTTLKQHGLGVRLGGFGGGSVTNRFGGGSEPSQFSPVFGPIIALEFPTYNVGTAEYSSFSIIGMVVPMEGGVTASGSVVFSF